MMYDPGGSAFSGKSWRSRSCALSEGCASLWACQSSLFVRPDVSYDYVVVHKLGTYWISAGLLQAKVTARSCRGT